MALLFLLLFFSVSTAELEKIAHPMKPDGSLSILAVGDWGRNGTFNQSQVAFQMGKIGEQLDINFIASLGDNFYDDGLKGVRDPFFKDSFTNIYTSKSLQKPWYAVLGNHDYRGNTLAQLNPVLRSIDRRWMCKRSFTVDAEIAEFFFIDTNPFVNKYWVIPNKHKYDWRGVLPRKKYLNNLLKDLDKALAKSTATWKVVLGHHTMRSVSEHGDTPELLTSVLPILMDHEVDLYINGHDHCLEHFSSKKSPIQFITSGGGSKAWRGVYNPPKEDKLEFFYDGQGFISLQFTKTEAKVMFYDVSGNVVHSWNTSKNLISFM